MSWKSTHRCPEIVPKMSWNVLESPGILILKFSGNHEFESKDFAENLSKDSSDKDLSNHVGHPYFKNVLDP